MEQNWTEEDLARFPGLTDNGLRGMISNLGESFVDGTRPNLADFVVGWSSVAGAVHANAVDKGFWDKPRNESEMLMLMVTELSEACEAIRKPGKPDKHVPEMGNLEVELADCVIRIMDYAHAKKLDVGLAILKKMNANAERPYMHGKKF